MAPSLLPLLAPPLDADGRLGHADTALAQGLGVGLVHRPEIAAQTLRHTFPPNTKERTYHAAERGTPSVTCQVANRAVRALCVIVSVHHPLRRVADLVGVDAHDLGVLTLQS